MKRLSICAIALLFSLLWTSCSGASASAPNELPPKEPEAAVPVATVPVEAAKPVEDVKVVVPDKQPEPVVEAEPEPVAVAAPEPIVEVEPVAAAAPEPIVVVEPEPEPPAEPEEEPFDPATITKDVFDSTKVDVQRLINQLNGFIRSRNYEAWVGYLSRQYLSVISNPEFLARISESSRLKSQKIVLKDVRDYFIHVVVPSRANDRVDDIEFIGQKRVKAFTVTEKGQRLRLYDLEKTERGWQIMN